MSRTVLVTGASRGIGRATAERLARTGWTVLAGVRDLAAAPPGTTPVLLDVTDAEQIAALPDAVGQRLDAVVNNAGIVVPGPVEALTPEMLRHQFEVNVVGQVAVSNAVLPALRAARGRIVHVTSLSGRVSAPMTGAYNASKFALEALADAQRVELRPWGIKVVAVEPGGTDTDIWRNAHDLFDETERQMGADHLALYSGHIAGMRRTVDMVQKTTVPVDVVVRAIDTALTSRRPRARYAPGVATKAQLAASAATPTWLFDRMLGRISGVPRTAD